METLVDGVLRPARKSLLQTIGEAYQMQQMEEAPPRMVEQKGKKRPPS